MANQVGNGPLSSEEAEILSTDAPTALDPRLQRLVARRLYGAIERPGTSTGQDEVAVIAKVTDRDAWEGLSDVRMGGVVGGADQDGTLIVTARIPVTRIEYLRQQPFVRSLKATQPLQPTLNRTIAETGAIAALLPAGNQSDGAAGVVVGIVDFGFDFVHRNFRNPDGSTRAISIWRQAGPANPASPFGYGREFSRDQINAALQQPDPYEALGYEPFPDSALPSPGTHGTHVADIAAGNGRGSGTPGVAPSAEIIFVDVSASDLPREGPEVVGSSFGDSTRLLEALLYIFDRAGDRPCVVNVSLGTNGGAARREHVSGGWLGPAHPRRAQPGRRDCRGQLVCGRDPRGWQCLGWRACRLDLASQTRRHHAQRARAVVWRRGSIRRRTDCTRRKQPR